jgi:hypothetical protein
MDCRSIPLRVADRVLARQDLKPLLQAALVQLMKYRTWIGNFEGTLARAKRADDLPVGFVWQDEFVDFWMPFTSIQKALLDISDRISGQDEGAGLAVEVYLDPPVHAQIEFATDSTQFLDRDGEARKQIAYDTHRLEIWHRNFSQWLERALREVKGLVTKI